MAREYCAMLSNTFTLLELYIRDAHNKKTDTHTAEFRATRRKEYFMTEESSSE